MEIDLKSIIDSYLKHNHREEGRQKQLLDYVDRTPPGHWFDRSNMEGHVTASGIVIDKSQNRMLAVNHVALKQWLQPGGHVESSDPNLCSAALREVAEETGIPPEHLKIIGFDSNQQVPLDIDTHKIEARPTKSEGAHPHFDFRYLMEYTGDGHLNLNKNEVKQSDWWDLHELNGIETFQPLIEKVRHLLSTEFRTKKFYDAIVEKALGRVNAKSIVVTHLIPDCIYYLRAINQLWPIAAVIPKPNSIQPDVRAKVEAEFPVLHVNRDDLARPDNPLVEVIRENQNSGEFILFDIGGYFSNISTWPADVLPRINLIVEDTENGHQKYLKVRPHHPVVSVARSPLKENEDFLVGQSILFSADALLRDGNMLVQYLKCGVFGYGKIGRSIASHLLQRGVKPLVYDTNPIRRLEAHNRLCTIPSRDEIIVGCDAIFCATGNKCLTIEDFRRLKSGCLVFSVTSSDDELDFGNLADEYKCEEIRDHIFKYSNFRNFFFLVNNGNAVNFLHKAVMGPFIHLVRAEMIYAAVLPNSRAQQDVERLNEVDEDIRKEIANVWLDVFDPEDRRISSMEYIQ